MIMKEDPEPKSAHNENNPKTHIQKEMHLWNELILFIVNLQGNCTGDIGYLELHDTRKEIALKSYDGVLCSESQ